MKNKLKILLITLGAVMAFPTLVNAEGRGAPKPGYVYIHRDGETKHVKEGSQAHTKWLEEREARREQAQREKELNKPDDGSSPYRDKQENVDWNSHKDNPGDKGNYTSGIYRMDSEYLKQNDGKTIKQVTAAGTQISGLASGVTKDPKTAGIAGAAGMGIGAAGALAGAVHYGDRAADYYTIYEKNRTAADTNESTNKNVLKQAKEKIDGQIKTLEAQKTFKNKKEKNERNRKLREYRKTSRHLQSHKKDLDKATTAQDNAADSARNQVIANTLFSVVNVAAAGAMGYMGYLQYENAKKLDDDKQKCEEDLTAPGCPGHNPNAGNNGPSTQRDDVPVPNRDNPGFEGFDDGSSRGLASGDGELGSGDLLQPPVSGSAGNGSLSFLDAPSPGANGSEKNEGEEDATGDGYSDEQGYGNAGGSGLGIFGGAAPFDSGFSGFDISNFLPAHLKNQGYNNFRFAKVNDKKKKKGIVLGKDSPSLFTRIKKAHKRKAPEMKKEVL